MSPMDVERFNADWLKAWSDKDVQRLVAFYTPDAVYRDPQTVDGLEGREALGAYLTELFASMPKAIYTPDETWPIAGGFCGRWYCAIGETGAEGRLRGFDLVLLEDGLIKLNEVYVHQLGTGA